MRLYYEVHDGSLNPEADRFDDRSDAIDRYHDHVGKAARMGLVYDLHRRPTIDRVMVIRLPFGITIECRRRIVTYNLEAS